MDAVIGEGIAEGGLEEQREGQTPLILAHLFANEDATSPLKKDLGPKDFFRLRSVARSLSIPPPQMPCQAMYLQLVKWTLPSQSHPWTFGITLPMASRTPSVSPRNTIPMALSNHYPASPPTPEKCRDPWRVPMSANVLVMALSDLVFRAAKAMFASSEKLSSSSYDIDLNCGRVNSPIMDGDILLNPLNGQTNVVTRTHPISQELAKQGVRRMHLRFFMPSLKRNFCHKMWVRIAYLPPTLSSLEKNVMLNFSEQEDGSIEQTTTDGFENAVPEEIKARALAWLVEVLTSPFECTWVMSAKFWAKSEQEYEPLMKFGQRHKMRMQHTCYPGLLNPYTGHADSSIFSTSVNIWVDEHLGQARFRIPS